MSKKYLKKKKKKIWPLILLGVLLVAGVVVGVVLWGPDALDDSLNQETESKLDVSAPTEAQVPLVQLETQYGYLYISETNADKLIHQELIDQNVVMERFSMVGELQEKELFRIYFGAENQGDPIGCFRTENGDILISVAVCTYESSDFSSEEDFALYHTVMEELNTILTSIFNDSRYIKLEKVVETETQNFETELKFWKLWLPEAMEWMEHDQNGLYWVDFYCMIAEDRILIYTVYLGETEADAQIGYYTVDGVQKPVWVKTEAIQPGVHWSDENVAEAYQFMSTINDVIQTIMFSENFAEQRAE